MKREKKKILPPEIRIPSKIYRIKIKESPHRRLVKEENFYSLELEDFEKVEYKPYETKGEMKEELPKIEFVIDKLYLQRITTDPSKLVLVVYLDYGYLKKNRVKEVVKVNKKKPFLSKAEGKCIIRLFNEDLFELAEIPMKHSSEFPFHPIASAPQLFLGLIENLKERKEYFYRVECYDRENKLLGASAVKNITASVHSPKKPIFFISTSDLHGGSKARFMRGKARGIKVRNNYRLKNLLKQIYINEPKLTFGYEFQVFTTSGDNVDNGSYHEYWADLFNCGEKVFSRIPVLPTIGNHDYNNGGIGRGSMFGGKRRTQKHFHMFFQTPRKSGGAFYSHTEGNTFMIHLDSLGLNWGNESISCHSRQWEWLNNELKEWKRRAKEENGPQFCFVFLHSAIFTIGYFGRARNNSDAIAQSCLTPLFDKYGITAAIFGHDHMYQRSTYKKTSYMCIGVSGKTPINYFNFLKDKTNYLVNKDEEGEKARGYAITYVPPNLNAMTEEEKKAFNNWLDEILELILENDLCLFYTFEGGRKSENYRKLMKNKDQKRIFIQENIIENLKTKVWWRYYNVKGELIDQVFIPQPEKEYVEIEKISCPAPHIR
ncbi:MAG: metallophosphoesterase family protein [Candidatus Heimdallarchaeaceae archaeon]